jgi:hypothetical protein
MAEGGPREGAAHLVVGEASVEEGLEVEGVQGEGLGVLPHGGAEVALDAVRVPLCVVVVRRLRPA